MVPLRPQPRVLSVGWCQWMSSAFSGCWSCRRGSCFFRAAGGWEGSHFLYVLTTRRRDFQNLFFFGGGKDELKETRKRCWILKFYQWFIWGISTILMEARVKIQVNQSARILIEFHVNLSPSYMDIGRITAWTGSCFVGKKDIWKHQYI